MSIKEDREFEMQMADSRHKQLNGALKDIAVSLVKVDEDIVNAIEKQGKSVEVLAKAIEDIPVAELPELDQAEVIESVKQIGMDIVQSNNLVIEALENRMMPDSFDLVKNNMGITTSVEVNYKQAKQLK